MQMVRGAAPDPRLDSSAGAVTQRQQASGPLTRTPPAPPASTPGYGET